jgi:hypothetical protein
MCQAVLALAGLVFHFPARAVEIGFAKCVVGPTNTCRTAIELRNAGRLSGLLGSMNYGSYILVSGEVTPMSAITTVCQQQSRPGVYVKTVCLVTPDDISAAELDGNIHVRALAIRPVDIPAAISATPYSQPPEVIGAYVTSVIHATGPFGTNAWHFIFGGGYIYYDNIDMRSGAHENVFMNDRIVVKYSNGQTEQFKFVGPNGPQNQQWLRVEGTLRNADGTDPAAPPPVAAIPVGGGLQLIPPPPWNGSLDDSFVSLVCSINAVTCVDGTCSTRRYDTICP